MITNVLHLVSLMSVYIVYLIDLTIKGTLFLISNVKKYIVLQYTYIIYILSTRFNISLVLTATWIIFRYIYIYLFLQNEIL